MEAIKINIAFNILAKVNYNRIVSIVALLVITNYIITNYLLKVLYSYFFAIKNHYGGSEQSDEIFKCQNFVNRTKVCVT